MEARWEELHESLHQARGQAERVSPCEPKYHKYRSIKCFLADFRALLVIFREH